jgi:peptide chain release factor 2
MILNTDLENIISNIDNINILKSLQEINKEIIYLSDFGNDIKLWSDYIKQTEIARKIAKLTIDKDLFLDINNTKLELLMSVEEGDNLLTEKLYLKLQELFNIYTQSKFLDGRFDLSDAILSIQVGAGGVDAEDWASMLVSMYQAFCMNQKWECIITEINVGLEGGVKKCSLKIQGNNVYGILKQEFGVHRLIRLSPFNSGHTRETSFALVEVIPLGLDDLIQIQILDSDLKWEFTTSQGAGGQSVNTTYSAVKLTHLPTQITVQCQNERSQVQNKQMALKYLKSKLSILEAQKRDEFKQEFRQNYQKPEWGSQIRNYVLHPYKLVKDLRSNWETSNVDAILEKGELLDMIWSIKKTFFERNKTGGNN